MTFAGQCPAEEPGQNSNNTKTVKRLLLLGQKPDGHPWSTHEYMAGTHIMAACLHDVPGLKTIVVQADDPWTGGPELLDGADGVVVFLSEGAKWVGSEPKRLAAFKRLAKRGGGLVCLHWGMGCRDAEYIRDYIALFGGCHGGPDRKFKVVEATLKPASDHPILRGIESFPIREEFYYRLKFPQAPQQVTPLIKVPIDGKTETVAWAWDRTDGGRSAGFSGGHFHENWRRPEYRRLMGQSILWTLRLPIPPKGLNVDVDEKFLRLAPRQESAPPKG